MSISVIIPAHNAERYLDATVASVAAQSRADWELIIVDDGSADGTVAIGCRWMERDPRVRLVSQPQSGVSNARNRGFAESSPERPFVAYLDSDDVWEPGALKRLTAALEANPTAPAVHGLGKYIDSEGRFIDGGLELWGRTRRRARNGRIEVVPCTQPTDFAALAFANCIITPGAALIRRSAHLQAGLWDSAPTPAEDYDLWLRLAALGDLAFVDEILLGYRVHSGNASSHRDRIEGSDLLARRKVFSDPLFTPEHRRMIGESWRAYQRDFAASKLGFARAEARRGRAGASVRQLCYGLRAYARSFGSLHP